MCDDQPTELGFAEPCEPWKVESRLFPSKIGGKPAWLNLEDLPTHEELQCKNCGTITTFLCQMYAPVEEEENASSNHFHRMLYVFVCRNKDCCVENKGNVKVFRSCLGRENKFYPYDPPENEPLPEFTLSKWVNLCCLCGCLADKKCSKCRNAHYCCKDHQVLDWKVHKKVCGKTVTDNTSESTKILFPEFEILTEAEEESEEKVIKIEEELEKFKKLEIEGKTGTLSDVPEEDLAAHALTEPSKIFKKFQKTVALNPDQIIRYKRGGDPLWISENPLPDSIPDCKYCGSARQYECQIMPQMLTFLEEHDLDWGVLCIYTCKNSCVEGRDYKEEFVFKQDL